MGDDLLSIREFARQDGCDEARVRRGIQRGELPARTDRRLPASLAGTAWRKGNRAADTPAAPPVKAGRSQRSPISLAEALRRREIALAELKRHELAALERDWLATEWVAAAWATVLAAIEQELSTVPAAAALRIAADMKAHEIRGIVDDLIYAALTELSQHDFGASTLPSKVSLRLAKSVSKLDAETAKVTAQAAIRRLEVEAAEGRTVPVDKAEDDLRRALGIYRQRLLNLCGTMPMRLVGLDDARVEAELRRVLADALLELRKAAPGQPEAAAQATRPAQGGTGA